jgi:RNA polymerase sigma factor (sigma-70 family)
MNKGMTEEEYNRLVSTHYEIVYGRCLNTVKNEELAQDLTQETFLKAYRFRKNWKRDAQAATWLYRICVNEIGMYYRARKSRIDSRLDPRPLDEVWEGELKNYTCEMLEPIDRKIFDKNLDALEWQIIYFKHQGYPTPEIAQILGKTLPAVKSKLNRLRAKLKLDRKFRRINDSSIPSKPIKKRKARVYKFKQKAKPRTRQEQFYKKAVNAN